MFKHIYTVTHWYKRAFNFFSLYSGFQTFSNTLNKGLPLNINASVFTFFAKPPRHSNILYRVSFADQLAQILKQPMIM